MIPFIWHPTNKSGFAGGEDGRILVICNPHSNRDRHRPLIPKEIKVLEKSGLDFIYIITEKPMDEYEFALAAIRNGFKTIIASGGDSTVSNIADAILSEDRDTIFGIIPNGTGNDYAGGNSIPLSLAKAVEIIKQRKIEKRDVIKIGDRYSVSLIGFGFDITMSEIHLKNRHLKGAPLYTYAIIAAIFKHKGFHIQVELDDGSVFEGKALMLNLGNNKISGGGYPTCPKADMTDGKLDVMFIQDCPPSSRLKMLQKVKTATHIDHPLVNYSQTKRVIVTSEKPLAFHTEGEIFYLDQTSITAEVIPKKLNLLVP
ncbi:MAG: diacylglycerol kinase family lipid kinase [Candidatus Aminicenantes bacterium]|nr:diacylglycerol kinase family lipid kinase [Candidatus Aminicenantes bacterium]